MKSHDLGIAHEIKTAKPKHTPTPWILKPRTDGLTNIYNAGGVHAVTLCATKGDGELIVRAVNAHVDLAEALRDEAATEHDKLSALLEDEDAGNDEIRDAAIDLCLALNARNQKARAALKKAGL